MNMACTHEMIALNMVCVFATEYILNGINGRFGQNDSLSIIIGCTGMNVNVNHIISHCQLTNQPILIANWTRSKRDDKNCVNCSELNEITLIWRSLLRSWRPKLRVLLQMLVLLMLLLLGNVTLTSYLNNETKWMNKSNGKKGN